MPRFRLLLAILTTLLALAVPFRIEAATFLVPSDRKLFDDCAAVAVVKVVSLQPRFDDDGAIVTEVVLEVEETIKGDVPQELRLVEMGGIVGNQRRIVSGTPEYFVGERALVFLSKRDGRWRTDDMLLGKFSFVNGEKGTLLIRGACEEEIFGWDALGNRHRERLRHAGRFLGYLRGRAAGLDPAADYFIDPFPRERPVDRGPFDPGLPSSGEASPGEQSTAEEGSVSSAIELSEGDVASAADYPPSVYTMGTSRWQTFDSGGTVRYRISGSQPGFDSVGVAQAALGAWTNEPNSNVSLALEGGAGGGFAKDGINSIIYNNSTDVPSGAIGYAQIHSVNQHTYKGELFWTVVEGDAIMKSGINVSASVFQEAVTHEVGHTIALRHSDQGTPSTTDAIMNSVITGRWGATLSPYDREAVSHVYQGTSGGPPPTFVFTDDPIVPGVTVIKAVHLRELRDAVNAVRAYAGLGAAGWTDPATPGIVVKAIHWTELLGRLNEARAALGLSPVVVPSAVQPGAVIRAAHIQALRAGVRL